ncbi:MAG: futalosine hydrolase [Fimbriimonadaceae bacterium]|nr:futalosine hydrolase [Chitinophagales bacterium]
MKLLFVVATRKEISGILKLFPQNKTLLYDKQELFSVNSENININILVTGAGMMKTIYQLTKHLLKIKYDLILNFGICGAFDRTLRIGEVIQIKSDLFSDLGAEDGEVFKTIFEIGLLNENTLPFKNGKIHFDAEVNLPCLSNIKKVEAITVNTVHGNDTTIKNVVEKFHAQVESMEGAAFGYVCKMENIPCLQIRSISNYMEKRNKENWNISLAVANLEIFIKQFLKESAI